MRQHGILILATIAVIVLCGCATSRPTRAVASSTETDTRASTLSPDLVGTWNGWFRPSSGADGGGGNGMAGDMMLEIKDDATYRLIWTRRGRGDAAGRESNDSGVVVANGRGITLKSSSSGQWISLMRKGNALYGVIHHAGSGSTLQIGVEKDSGTSASPKH